MKDAGKYDISFSGKFVDGTLEREFIQYDMKYFSGLIGPVALIFGLIYMLFVISDYFVIGNHTSFLVILSIRTMFLIGSIYIFFAVKKINDYSNLVKLITAYEVGFLISFIVIIYQYGPIGLIPFFSTMAITLALYITPNKLINAQIISVLFNLFFIIFYVNYIDHVETGLLLKIFEYILIFIIFGNIEAYLTNYYRRKQFADSRELLRISITDSLTGIYNRVKFNQELSWWIDHCNMNGNSLLLVIFDIDDFKKVNDNYGHLIGDNVLQNVTSVIKNAIRSTDIFARWGGDEFVILLPNTDMHQALEITERMRIFIQETRFDGIGNITCSFGLVLLRRNDNTQSLLQRADKFLYKAKEQGKNTVSFEVTDIGGHINTDTYAEPVS